MQSIYSVKECDVFEVYYPFCIRTSVNDLVIAVIISYLLCYIKGLVLGHLIKIK